MSIYYNCHIMTPSTYIRDRSFGSGNILVLVRIVQAVLSRPVFQRQSPEMAVRIPHQGSRAPGFDDPSSIHDHNQVVVPDGRDAVSDC